MGAGLFGLFGLSGSLGLTHKINETNQTDRIDQTNQINQFRRALPALIIQPFPPSARWFSAMESVFLCAFTNGFYMTVREPEHLSASRTNWTDNPFRAWPITWLTL